VESGQPSKKKEKRKSQKDKERATLVRADRKSKPAQERSERDTDNEENKSSGTAGEGKAAILNAKNEEKSSLGSWVWITGNEKKASIKKKRNA